MDINLVIRLVVALCRKFEGFSPRPYLCPAGVPTIGYGSTYYEDGRKVQLTDPPITQARAELLLINQVRRVYLPQTVALCPGADTAGRLGALVDFDYNLGSRNLKTSTLRRCVNAGDWEAVRVQLMRWNRGGGRVLKGLTRRRTAEAAICSEAA